LHLRKFSRLPADRRQWLFSCMLVCTCLSVTRTTCRISDIVLFQTMCVRNIHSGTGFCPRGTPFLTSWELGRH